MISYFNTELLSRSIPNIDIVESLDLLKRSFANNGFDIDVTFVEVEQIAELNQKYRGNDQPTDVLSFEPVLDIEDPKADVFVCVEYIKNARKLSTEKLSEEILRMIIHGVLHIMGMDHTSLFDETKEISDPMYLEQERILNVVLEQARN